MSNAKIAAVLVCVGMGTCSVFSCTLGDLGTGGAGGAGGGADDFTGVDPQTLNKESLKAAVLGYYLISDIDSMPGLDANTDDTMLEALAVQEAPSDEMQVNDWMATLDPSAIPAASVIPRYECTEQHGCPYKTKCFNSGTWDGAPPYECAVVDCGTSKCTDCPNWVPDTLKSIVFKSWCAYVCAVRLPPRDVVAVGAVGIKKNGDPWPATGAWCFKP
jgi:hypothetical protein